MINFKATNEIRDWIKEGFIEGDPFFWVCEECDEENIWEDGHCFYCAAPRPKIDY